MGINRMGSEETTQKPKRPVLFTDCSVSEVEKYELTDEDIRKDDLEDIVQL